MSKLVFYDRWVVFKLNVFLKEKNVDFLKKISQKVFK